MAMSNQLILASASQSRARLLTNAGVMFDVKPAHVDEDAIKSSLRAEGATAAHIAEVLAETKALRVSRGRPEFVLAADQMLQCDEEFFDKATTREDARRTLTALRGRTHDLPTAACIAKEGAVIWRSVTTPQLTMRMFSDAFREAYLDALGEAAFNSVGVYHLEGYGSQLFSKIEGDFFTILGLPLVEVLDFLRQHRLLQS